MAPAPPLKRASLTLRVACITPGFRIPLAKAVTGGSHARRKTSNPMAGVPGCRVPAAGRRPGARAIRWRSRVLARCRRRPVAGQGAAYARQGPAAEGRRPAHHLRRRLRDHQAGGRHTHDAASQLRARAAALPVPRKRGGQQLPHATGARRLPRRHRPHLQGLAERGARADQHRHHRDPRHRLRRAPVRGRLRPRIEPDPRRSAPQRGAGQRQDHQCPGRPLRRRRGRAAPPAGGRRQRLSRRRGGDRPRCPGGAGVPRRHADHAGLAVALPPGQLRLRRPERGRGPLPRFRAARLDPRPHGPDRQGQPPQRRLQHRDRHHRHPRHRLRRQLHRPANRATRTRA